MGGEIAKAIVNSVDTKKAVKYAGEENSKAGVAVAIGGIALGVIVTACGMFKDAIVEKQKKMKEQKYATVPQQKTNEEILEAEFQELMEEF